MEENTTAVRSATATLCTVEPEPAYTGIILLGANSSSTVRQHALSNFLLTLGERMELAGNWLQRHSGASSRGLGVEVSGNRIV